MGLLGSIVTMPVAGPIKGMLWIVKTIAEHAERELYDEDNIRKDLLKLEQQYELGKMDTRGIRERRKRTAAATESSAKNEGRTLTHVTAPPAVSRNA